MITNFRDAQYKSTYYHVFPLPKIRSKGESLLSNENEQLSQNLFEFANCQINLVVVLTCLSNTSGQCHRFEKQDSVAET